MKTNIKEVTKPTAAGTARLVQILTGFVLLCRNTKPTYLPQLVTNILMQPYQKLVFSHTFS